MKRFFIIFTGQVQGVGFRWTLLTIMNRYGYTGWVKNLYNGNVSAEIQGKNINVPQLVAEIQNASYWIKIDDYTCKEIPIVEHENSAYVDIDF